MAAIITSDFTVLYDGNSSIGGASTVTSFPRFGSTHNAFQIGNETQHFTTTIAPFNFNGFRIYTWMIGPGGIGTLSQGGYRIVIGDGTNTRAYFVGGRDIKNFISQNWGCFILDSENLPTEFEQLNGSAQPNLSSISLVGVGMRSTVKATGNSPNAFFDVMQYGTGLFISGGTENDPGTFDDIVAADNSNSNAWGVIEDLGGNVYAIQGQLTFGSSSQSTYFIETNTTLLFRDNIVGPDTYKINTIASSSNTNILILGERLGTGENSIGINGCSVLSPSINVEVNLNTPNFDVINIYGSTFSDIGNIDINLSDISSHEFISNTIINSGQVITGSSFMRRNNFISTTSSSAALLWNENINIKDSSFIANTQGAAIEHSSDVGNPFTYDELRFNNNDFDILNSSGVELTINAVNGANPSNFTGNNTIINNPTTFRVTGLVPDTEVRIFRQSNREELAGVENSGTEFEYNYNYSGDITVYLVVHKEEFEYIKIRDIVLDENDRSIPIQQRVDRNYIL